VTLCLLHFSLIVLWIKLYQHLSFSTPRSPQHVRYRAINPAADLMNVTGNRGVIGPLVRKRTATSGSQTAGCDRAHTRRKISPTGRLRLRVESSLPSLKATGFGSSVSRSRSGVTAGAVFWAA